jgi:magnesium transporter
MPELHLRWGYFGALGLIAAIMIGLYIMFKRNHWL